MKNKMKIKNLYIFLVLISVLSFGFYSCQKDQTPEEAKKEETKYKAPTLIDGGKRIIVDMRSTDQIQSMVVGPSNVSSNLKAPCKVIMSSQASKQKGITNYLYETNELSDLFSEYSKTKNLISKATRQVEMLKILVSNNAAAGKDLIEAETELSGLKTSLAALESKLKVMGLDAEDAIALGYGKVIVIADLPESLLQYMKVGKTVKILFNSFPTESFNSRVVSIGSVVDPLTRTVKIQVILENSNGKLMPGLYGQMQIDVNDEAKISVPLASLFSAKGKNYVFVESDKGQYDLKEVLLGVQGTDWVEIIQGIEPNTKVVVKGTMLLKSISFGY